MDPNPSDVFAAIKLCGLMVLQFHGAETPEFCAQFGVMTMKAFRLKDAASLRPMAGFQADAFLLDSYVPEVAGGTGETFNWDLALEAKRFGKPDLPRRGIDAAKRRRARCGRCSRSRSMFPAASRGRPGKRTPKRCRTSSPPCAPPDRT